MAPAASQSVSEEGHTSVSVSINHVLSASLLQAGACDVSMQMGRHASEAAGSSSSEASHSGRTGNSGLTDVWLQHAWKLPASPHLAVAAEGNPHALSTGQAWHQGGLWPALHTILLLQAAWDCKPAKDHAQALYITTADLTSLPPSRQRSDGLSDKGSSAPNAGSICRQAWVRDGPYRDSWRPCKPRAFRHSSGKCSAHARELRLRWLTRWMPSCAAAMCSQ